MPRSRPARLAALAAALLLGGGLLGSALPATAAPQPAAPPAAGHRTAVWLPTGDVVSYDPAHPKALRVRTRVPSGPGSAWRSMTRKGHLYVFPLSATPFLGTVLDPSLFDVTALAGNASPTIHVTNAGTAKAALPGLTATGAGSGRFSHAGARTFGAALQKAAVAAKRSATAPRSLFGASAVGLGSTGPIVPHFQQQTVIFKAIGSDGKPLPEGQLFYGNLDDAARGSDFAFIVDGEVRVSLPAGHYTLAGEDDELTDTSFTSLNVTNPNLAITGAKDQVVTLDFRTATATPSVSLPVKATPQDYAIDYERNWDTGGFGSTFFGDASGTVRYAPAPKPQIGTVTLADFATAVDATGGEYDTYVSRSGAIPADLHSHVAASQFAAVRERIFATGSDAFTLFGHGVVNPDGSGIGMGRGVDLPLDRIDHLYATPGTAWADSVMIESSTDDPFGGEVDDAPRFYGAGSSTTAEWLRQAVAPQVPRFSATQRAEGVSCPACRIDGELFVALSPLQDTAATGHFGYLYDESTGDLFARARLYRNGALIDDEPGSNFVDAVVPAGKADYRIVADSTPAAAGFRLGTAATTTWTFASAARSGGALPGDVSCSLDGPNCRILPLLSVRAPLPTDLSGTVGLGTHPFTLTIEPIQGAPASAVHAKVEVSFDGGKTWVAQPVTAHGANCFRVALTNPASAAGTRPSVRITGTDAAGGSVVQTVTAAYRVGTR